MPNQGENQIPVLVLILILATVVLIALGGALAVGMFVRSREYNCGCGRGRADISRLTSSDTCIVPVVYPFLDEENNNEASLTDIFPWYAPYVLYKPHLGPAALTADIKANFAAFGRNLTYTGWEVSRCYLLDSSSHEVHKQFDDRLPPTCALFQLVDADKVQRLVLMSRPFFSSEGPLQVATLFTITLYTTDEATDLATYTGTWTTLYGGPGYGPVGPSSVSWWVPSPTPACIAPVLYVSIDDMPGAPYGAPYLPYKPYLGATDLTADFKSNYPFSKTTLEYSEWTVSRCYMMDVSSPEALEAHWGISAVLQVTEANFGDRLVIMALTSNKASVTLYTADSATDHASYSGTWTFRAWNMEDTPNAVEVVWGKIDSRVDVPGT
jgi:hypothetical protein